MSATFTLKSRKSLKCVRVKGEKEREYDKTIVINVNTSGIEAKNI